MSTATPLPTTVLEAKQAELKSLTFDFILMLLVLPVLLLGAWVTFSLSNNGLHVISSLLMVISSIFIVGTEIIRLVRIHGLREWIKRSTNAAQQQD